MTRVTIYDTKVTGIFLPGGDGWHFMGLVGTEHLNQAIAFAPSRTGTLKASHYPVPIMTPYRAPGGAVGCRYTIRNDAPYADYVHGGTTGPIMGHRGYLWVPQRRGSSWPRYLARSVAGQDANPWLEKAAAVALAPYVR